MLNVAWYDCRFLQRHNAEKYGFHVFFKQKPEKRAAAVQAAAHGF